MKKTLRAILQIITVGSAIGYFICCLTPYLSPRDFWPIAFCELGFPFMALAIILLIITWFFIRRKFALLLCILLLTGYKNLFSTVGFNIAPGSEKTANPTLKIITWNVRGFWNPATAIDGPTAPRRLMFDYLKRQDADILCFQEFNEHKGAGMFSNTKELVSLGYKYYYRTNDINRLFPFGLITGCSVIFSKIPISDTGRTILGDPSFPESLGHADVMLDQRPLRIFSGHFKSLNLHAALTDSIDVVVFHGDSQYVYQASAFEKIKVFSQEHAIQARIVKQELENCKIPYLVSVDLNATPASYAYHLLSDGLQDAFLTKSYGLGRTLDSMPATMRIDYILADKRIRILQYRKDTVRLSDHFPQFVEIAWKD